MVELDWKDFLTTLLSSGLVLSAITTYYSGTINVPKVNINPTDSTRSTFLVNNIGLTSATSLTLTIENFSAEPNVFSTENYTKLTHSSTQLVLHFPRLATGQASMILIKHSGPKTKVYATYDQGSIKFPYVLPDPYSRFQSLLPVIVLAISGAISFNYLFHRLAVKQKFRFLASKIWMELHTIIYETLNEEKVSKEIQTWLASDDKSLYAMKEFSKLEFEDQAKIFKEEDLKLINDFYKEVLKREEAATEVAKEKEKAEKEKAKESTNEAKEGNSKKLEAAKEAVKEANNKVKDAALKAFNCIEWIRFVPIQFQIKSVKNPAEKYGYGLGKARTYYPVQITCWVVTISILFSLIFWNDLQKIGIVALIYGVGVLFYFIISKSIDQALEQQPSKMT